MDMMAVPERRPAKLSHFTVSDDKILVMPERIAQIEICIADRDVSALLEGALAIRRSVKSAVHNLDGILTVKCSFLIELHVFISFHILPPAD
jgi:hypothetical protein